MFDKLLLGSIGLSHAVHDAAAVPQQSTCYNYDHLHTRFTTQTQTRGPDPLNLQLRLRLSTSPELYHDLFHFEGCFEFCESSSKTQYSCCSKYRAEVVVSCTCGKCSIPTENTRPLTKQKFDASSISHLCH